MVLRECPASDYFGQSKVKLNVKKLSKSKAGVIVLQMVRRVQLQLVDKISEKEKDQSSSGSGSHSDSMNQRENEDGH